MKCITGSAEEKIREAAKKIFMEKGFDGTTTRDIAKEAGVNSALMNYYFRSKEKLFASVFSDVLKMFFMGLIEIINKPIDLREKVSEMLDHDFNMCKKHSNVSNFIHQELHRDPDGFLQNIPLEKLFDHSLFDQQLKKEIAAGEIRAIETKHLILLMVGSVQFVFHSKVMSMHMWNMNEEQFFQFAEKHKGLAKEMILNYLFTPKPAA